MNFYGYIHSAYSRSINNSNKVGLRNALEKIIDNKHIQFSSHNDSEVYQIIKDEYENNDKVIIFIDSLWCEYQKYKQDEARKTARVNDANSIWLKVLDNTDCCHDSGEIRSQFKRRPDLYLMAMIAGGLYEIADAIRGK